jgi:hypothetical protein
MPALPLDEGGAYVAAAYTIFVSLLVIYVVVMARHIAQAREHLQRLDDALHEEER